MTMLEKLQLINQRGLNAEGFEFGVCYMLRYEFHAQEWTWTVYELTNDYFDPVRDWSAETAESAVDAAHKEVCEEA